MDYISINDKLYTLVTKPKVINVCNKKCALKTKCDDMIMNNNLELCSVIGRLFDKAVTTHSYFTEVKVLK